MDTKADGENKTSKPTVKVKVEKKRPQHRPRSRSKPPKLPRSASKKSPSKGFNYNLCGVSAAELWKAETTFTKKDIFQPGAGSK